MRNESMTAAELNEIILRKGKFRGLVRALVGVLVAIALMLGYSLIYVRRDSPEFIVALLSLGMDAGLFAACLLVNQRLTRSLRRHVKEYKDMQGEDAASPWKI